MSKTQRILSYLPYIYRTEGIDSLLFRVVDAFGQPMLEAENLLFEVMRSHWVDFADQGKDRIHDLALLGALYNLAPRDDEDVETFRTHLKSYVRSYLKSAATIPGILRLAASTLALSLEEDLDRMPGTEEYLIENTHPQGDGAMKLLGFLKGEASGIPPAPARVYGKRDLSGGIQLNGARFLRLQVDKETIAKIDLSQANRSALDLWDIASQINNQIGLPNVATHNSHTLALTSLKAGPEAQLQIDVLDGDAADLLLGIASRNYTGSDSRPAQVRGIVDHALLGGLPVVDLTEGRYLRVSIDGKTPAEVDCVGTNYPIRGLEDVCIAINNSLGVIVASHDGHYLTLTSPTVGPASRLDLSRAPASDALPLLLGEGLRLHYRGASGTPAVLKGRADLPMGVDLSTRSLISLALDGGSPVEIDCAGVDPTATSLIEIVERINAAFGEPIAAHNGHTLTLTSTKAGSASQITIHTPSDPARDATDLILGVAPREYDGTEPGQARLVGLIAPEEPIDMRIQRRLWLSVDGTSLPVIDCANPDDPQHTTLQHAADAINKAAGTTVAFPEEGRLVLQSPTEGEQSLIVVRAPEKQRRRFFYHSGLVREDAASVIFGFAARKVTGIRPGPARLTGQVDLSRGADLRVANTLRLQVDDDSPIDINVARTGRPQVTTLENVIDAINQATGKLVASHRGSALELTSEREGLEGRIALSPSTASDAGMVLLGLPPEAAAYGKPAGQVVFTGLPDISRGVDILDTYHLRLSMDDCPEVEVDLRNALGPGDPALLTPTQIKDALNLALGTSFASEDGRHIVLTSQQVGTNSKLTIRPGLDHDASPAVFGLTEERTYVGAQAERAILTGTVDLSAGVDLNHARHLSLEVDGKLIADIDCAEKEADTSQVSLAAILAHINKAAHKVVGSDIAGKDTDGHLFLASPSQGAGSSVRLLQSTAADARSRVLGDVPAVTLGTPGTPAQLTGEVKLRRPVDLSRRSLIRLRVDGGDLREINLAGENPQKTYPAEVVDKINAVFPDLAAIGEGSVLALTAPKNVELLPQRTFNLFEYLPIETVTPDQPVRQRLTWSVNNKSVRAEPLEWILDSLHGVDRPRLTHQETRRYVQVNAVVPAGWILHVHLADDASLSAWLETPGQPSRTLVYDPDKTYESEIYFAEYLGPNKTDRLLQPEDVLILPTGESHWQYDDCYGDRFNQTYFGSRKRRKSFPDAHAGHFGGGKLCRSLAIFNSSRFNSEKDNLEEVDSITVFGSQKAVDTPQASVHFSYQTHQPGHFELQIPSDLPPQFGGRFNQMRFAQGNGSDRVYPAVIFDELLDETSIIKQLENHPGILKAGVQTEESLETGTPVYQVPFREFKPLVKGSNTEAARAYLLYNPDFGYIELNTKDPGTWGNEVFISVPEAKEPGTFDLEIRYTGKEVFENAVAKVREQVAFARAAGVLAQVTRR
jgi:hypothetical protein